MANLLNRTLVLRGLAGVSGLAVGARLGGAVAVTLNHMPVDPSPCVRKRGPGLGNPDGQDLRTPASVQGFWLPQA